MSGAPDTPLALAIEYDPLELACRIAEAVAGLERPEGTSAAVALAALRNPRHRQCFLEAAEVAMAYFLDQARGGSPPS